MLKKVYRQYLAILAPALLSAAPALSQTSGNTVTADSEGLQEIIVTATKRQENLQLTPAAVTALTGENLAAEGITDMLKLEKDIPSLQVSTKGGVDSLIFLRGVGQTVGANNTADGVAVNLNNVALPREVGIPELFDMERVEVLPGPQGTLYGGSAAGGVINFITARPTNEFSADGSIESGNYGLVHLTGDINSPVGDKAAVRFAINYNRNNGYLTNGLDDTNALNARLSVRLQPIDDLSIFVMLEYDDRGGNGPGNILKGPGAYPYQSPSHPWVDNYPLAGLFLKDRTYVGMAEINYHFADTLNLSYIPSAVYSENQSVQQFQFLYGSPFQTVSASFPVAVHQYSQELRLFNDAGARGKWITGLYWSTSTHYFALLDPPTDPLITSTISNTVNNWAAFGQYTYSLFDSWRLTVGGRVSQDTYNGGGSVVAFGSGYDYGGNQTHNMADWKIGTEVDLSAKSMAYFTVQTGYVMGGYAQVPSTSDNPKDLPPEKLLSYTLGVKNRFLNDKLQVNDELFYYDYKDYQLQLLKGLTNAAVSVPKTRIYGDQIDVKYRFTPKDELELDAEYTSARIASGLLSGTTTNLQGFQLPDAPFVTVSAGYTHDFHLWNDGTVSANVHTYFNSGSWNVFTHDENSLQTSYTKTDVNLSYAPPRAKWKVGLWARNLENKAVYAGCSAATAPGDPVGCFVEPPRTFGVRLEGHL